MTAPPMRSFGFHWYCACGAAWKGNLVRSPRNPDIRPVIEALRWQWTAAHSGPGHRETDSGHEAAWARRKAEEEAVHEEPRAVRRTER